MRVTTVDKDKKEKVENSVNRIYLFNNTKVRVRIRFSDLATEAEIKRYMNSVKLEQPKN
jgi:hypothetical protein